MTSRRRGAGITVVLRGHELGRIEQRPDGPWWNPHRPAGRSATGDLEAVSLKPPTQPGVVPPTRGYSRATGIVWLDAHALWREALDRRPRRVLAPLVDHPDLGPAPALPE